MGGSGECFHGRGFPQTTIVVRTRVAREKSVSQDFTRLTLNANPALGCWGKKQVEASGARGLALPRQAGTWCPAGRAWGSALSLFRVTFPCRNRRAPRRKAPARGGEQRGRHRGHRWAAGPSGAAASARGSGPEGAAERARPRPRDPATRVGPGTEHLGRLRPSRHGWHGRAHGWELYNLVAAPAGPASSRGDPEPGAAAGCPRDPCRRRPPWASPASAASTGRAPRPCPGGSASAPPAPHGARAAIATHRGRRGSGPPIRVAPSFPG